MKNPSLLFAALALASVASCVGSGTSAQLRQQAEASLQRWADAVAAAGGPSAVVPVGDQTGQVGDWEAEVGDNNKRALIGGLVEADGPLPSALPPDGDVTWGDGTAASVHLMTAEQAIAAIRAGTSAPCDDCTALRVSGARLTSAPMQTTRGPATGPVWEFSVRGTAVKVTHVALANAIVVKPPAWDASNPAGGMWLDSAEASASGQEVTVTFVGSPLAGDKPCGEDYTAEAVESDLAVVVIVVSHSHISLFGCSGPAVGATRTAVAELAAPLGDRAVLQVHDGTPIPIVLTP